MLSPLRARNARAGQAALRVPHRRFSAAAFRALAPARTGRWACGPGRAPIRRQVPPESGIWFVINPRSHTAWPRGARPAHGICVAGREDERSAWIVAWSALSTSCATPLTSENIMKRDLKSRNKALRMSGETIRTLGSSQLVDVAGGTSNNGCTNGSTSFAPSICHFCLQ